MADSNDQPLGGLTQFVSERFLQARCIGSGNNATVFRAWDQHLQREVVFKVAMHEVLVDALGTERLEQLGIADGVRALVDEATNLTTQRYTLLREARLLASVDHPNVVSVLEIGVLDDGAVAVVMPYLGGGSLDEREFTGPWQQVLDVALQIGAGLEALHQAGILHRDFKPNNILFGDDGRPRIVDLGLSCRLDDEHAMADWVGTGEYMAPEALAHRSRDVRDDLYAYCMVVYRMFYGHSPFASMLARSHGRVTAAVREAGMSKALHGVLVRGLAADPEQRWPDMRSLLQAMRHVLTPTVRRWQWLVGAVTAALAIGVFAAATAVQADDCDDVAHELDMTWNHDIEIELRGVLGSRVDADGLANWVGRWLTVRTRECATAKRQGQPVEPQPCMDSARDRFRSTVATLRSQHGRAGLRFSDVIDDLPDPEHCIEHPDDREHNRGGLLALHDLDVQIGVLVSLGNLDAARDRQQDYMQRARAQLSSYDIGRAVFWRGELNRQSGDSAVADTDLALAYEQAVAIDAEELAGEASMQLAVLAGQRGDTDLVDAYARVARTWFARCNPDRVAEVDLAQGLGLLQGDAAAQQRALGYLEHAVSLREQQRQRYSGSRERVGQALEGLARAQLVLGQHEQAIASARESLSIHLERYLDGTPRSRDLRRLLFTAQLSSQREREADETILAVIEPLWVAEDYDVFFVELYWFIEQARALGAQQFADNWLMQARSDAEQARYNFPIAKDHEGPR